jgi:membrane-bound ClpP family serine protease
MRTAPYVTVVVLAVVAVGLFLRPEHRLVHSSWPSVKTLTELNQMADLVMVGRIMRVNRTMKLEPGESLIEKEIEGKTIDDLRPDGQASSAFSSRRRAPFVHVGHRLIL